MAREDLLVFLKRLLHTNEELEFLLRLDQADLMTLVSLIRVPEASRQTSYPSDECRSQKGLE